MTDFHPFPYPPSDSPCGECGTHTSSYFQIEEHIVCRQCAERMTLEELAEYFGVDSICELFIELGIPFSGLFDDEVPDDDEHS